jgi:hypothetical protein
MGQVSAVGCQVAGGRKKNIEAETLVIVICLEFVICYLKFLVTLVLSLATQLQLCS